MPQHQVLVLKSAHKQLIHGSDDKIGKHGLFASREPVVNNHRIVVFVFLAISLNIFDHAISAAFQGVCQSPPILIEFSFRMKQLYGVASRIIEIVYPREQTWKNAIRSRLCRQGEKYTSPAGLPREYFRCCKGCFRFAIAHGRFNDENARLLHGLGNIDHALLQDIGRGKAKAVQIIVMQIIGEAQIGKRFPHKIK